MTDLMPDEQLIKSLDRVRAHGEVFTPKYMVNQMLDLVNTELESSEDFVGRTFFEPAAGSGNFLVAILERKLNAVASQFQIEEWTTESLFSLSSIYGIEILEDNHQVARKLLLDVFVAFHDRAGIPCGAKTELRRSAVKIIDCNIVQGNTLSGLDAEGAELQFSWWNRNCDDSRLVKREPFTLSSLRESPIDTAMIDFVQYESFEVCRIEQVYKEAKE